jgi:protoheme IX farnesyltransferase
MSDASTPAVRYASAGDYIGLLKPRIMGLVVFTGIAGLVAAQHLSAQSMHPFLGAIAILSIALGAGAAGAINMWYDADIDAVMKRTSARPIPSGAVPRPEALTLGIVLSIVSVLLMWLAATPLAAILLAGSIFYYGVVYTMWLKRATPQNIVIGGGAGAFPPVIGWAAVTGSAPLDAWILFAIIFFWTPPHFWALSLVAHGEYAKAKVPMLPVTHGAKATRLQILLYTIVLLAVTAVPVFTGLGGAVYATAAILCGLVFLVFAIAVYRSKAGDQGAPVKDQALARRMFFVSIVYLFLLFAVLLLEHGFGLYWPLLLGGA